MARRSLKALEVAGKRALVRVDFNVPLKAGHVEDDSRVRAALPTLRWLIERGARLVVMSHLGRPKGKVRPELSLAPVGRRLSELLGCPVALAPDAIGAEVEAMTSNLQAGGVLLLENLRFHPGETQNDPEFAGALARLGEVYVNDAFGAAHRAHASTEGVARLLTERASGLLLERELTVLGEMLAAPRRPFVAILGGAKISGKIDVIETLLPRLDRLLVGGGMMYTFLKAKGLEIGKSLLEEDRVAMARGLIERAGDKLLLPIDTRVAPSVDAQDRDPEIVAVDGMPADQLGVDIGPATVRAFGEALRGAGTVFWNGPLGIFEVPVFAKGTVAIAAEVARATDDGATSIVGGGDSVAAIHAAGCAERVTHLSTGGGATLEFLEGKALPGVAALEGVAV